MISRHLERNRWHDPRFTAPSKLTATYGTPRAWFRRSLMSNPADLKNSPSLQDEQFIRCAAVFRSGQDINPFLRDCWGVWIAGNNREWQMIVASPRDALSWIENAYNAGALAWYWADDAVPVWYYRAVDYSNDIEESALEDMKIARRVKTVKLSDDDYPRLIQDIRAGTETITDLALKYKISRTMIYNIIRKNNLKPPPAGSALLGHKHKMTAETEQLIIEDIRSARMTRAQIARKHNLDPNAIAAVITRNNLMGILPRGGAVRTARANAGRPRVYDYDEEAIVYDLKNTSLRAFEIAAKHGLKETTLAGIQHKHGIRRLHLVDLTRKKTEKANKKAP